MYDIFPIEMVEQGVTSPTSTTNPIVTQNKPSVNSHSMQNTAKNAQEGKEQFGDENSLGTGTVWGREQFGDEQFGDVALSVAFIA